MSAASSLRPSSQQSGFGFIDNLSKEQEKRLQEMWTVLILAWKPDVEIPRSTRSGSVSSGSTIVQPRFFQLRHNKKPQRKGKYVLLESLHLELERLGASSHEIKGIRDQLIKIRGQKLRTAFLTMLKHQHPDAALLRFLRYEKWNVPKSLTRLIAVLYWRVYEYNIDYEILLKGEEYALEKSRQIESSEAKLCEEFMYWLKITRGFLHGADKQGRPVVLFRADDYLLENGLSKPLKTFFVHCTEIAQILMVPPVESMTMLCDLTQFSYRYWEPDTGKFLFDLWNHKYPEIIAKIIFYNAPWLFNGIGKFYQSITFPSSTGEKKYYFCNSLQDLEEVLPREHIQTYFGGDEDWDWDYIEPLAHENDKLHNTAERHIILVERNNIGDEFFAVTQDIISGQQTGEILARRNELIKLLSDNYWRLDPYVRARTIFDRIGVIKGDGVIDFYPLLAPKAENKKLEYMD